MNIQSATRLTHWPEHWTNSGTGITKFDADRLPIYEAAIAESGDPDLFTKNNELHDRQGPKPRELGPFWTIVRRLQLESEKK